MAHEYTNTRASLVIAGIQPKEPAKEGEPAPGNIPQRWLPGETKPVDASCVTALERSAVYKAGHLKKGTVAMPPPEKAGPRFDTLPDDLVTALAAIKLEDRRPVLVQWTEQEQAGPKRSDVLEALLARARVLG